MKKEIGLKVKQARESQGISQRELAEKAGLSSGYIGMIESGASTPSITALEKIGKALNVDTKFFLEKEPGVLFDQYKDHLTLKEKEFIAQQKNRPWITLNMKLAELDLSPKQVHEAIEVMLNLRESRDKNKKNK